MQSLSSLCLMFHWLLFIGRCCCKLLLGRFPDSAKSIVYHQLRLRKASPTVKAYMNAMTCFAKTKLSSGTQLQGLEICTLMSITFPIHSLEASTSSNLVWQLNWWTRWLTGGILRSDKVLLSLILLMFSTRRGPSYCCGQRIRIMSPLIGTTILRLVWPTVYPSLNRGSMAVPFWSTYLPRPREIPNEARLPLFLA